MARKIKQSQPVAAAAAVIDRPRRPIEQTLEHTQLNPAIVLPSKFQPRHNFPDAEIKALADSIAEQGQIHPILVRPLAGAYELLDGERRLRAVQLLGWETIRAEVGEFTDAQARQIVLASAIQRQDLNPIEEARAMKNMLDAGDVISQSQLAEILGIEQGTVSNRLRLLDLPKEWKQKVISREISERHARAVLPFNDHPRIMAALLARMEDEIKNNGGPPTCEQWEKEGIPDLLFDDKITRTLDGTDYDFKTFRHIPKFTPTEEERKELAIISIQRGKGKEEFATNTKLWDKLQAAFKKEYLKKQETKEKKGKSKGKEKAGEALTPAEIKKRQKKRDKQYARRFAELVTNVKRWAIAEEFGNGKPISDADHIRLLLCCIADWSADSRLQYTIGQLAAGKSPPTKGKYFFSRPSKALWHTISGMEDLAISHLASDFLVQCFYPNESDGPSNLVNDDQVAAIFDYLALSMERIWEQKYLGPFTEGYFNLHGKEALTALMTELKLGPDPAAKKSDLVAHCMDAAQIFGSIAFPKELREKAPKKKSKTKK